MINLIMYIPCDNDTCQEKGGICWKTESMLMLYDAIMP